MSLQTNDEQEPLFGGEAPPAIRVLLARAKQAGGAEAVELLCSARTAQPDCLPVYYLLYKLHARQGELDLAEQVARAALAEAGRQAGLPGDVRTLAPERPMHADFAATGPARFWLFTLKALAFINLRLHRRDDAEKILSVLAAHDPSHSVGGAVTEALLRGSAP